MVKFEPVQKKRVSDLVTDQILELIGSGELSPGDRLPSEADLMTQIGVGRPSLRSALHTLEAMNIIEIRQGVGAIVCEMSAPLFPVGDDISKLFSPRSIVEAIAVRRMLEPEIAAAAAQAATKDDLEALQEALNALNGDSASGVWPKSRHIAFHLRIAEATHNQLLVHIQRFLMLLWEEGLERAFDLRPSDRGDVTRIVSEHKLVYNAIVSGDPVKARKAMLEHVSVTADRLTALRET